MHPGRKPNGRLKIKVEQATCDQCRAKGVTCQAPDSVDERCGQCEEGNVICTWRIGPRPMGRSPPSPEFVSYLESQVGKVEKKLREILPGVNLNRELETLSQLPSSPPRHQPTYGHLEGESQSSSGGATPFQHADHEPSVLYSAPQLLKQVRLASEAAAGSSHSQQLRTDTYWSDTASTRPKEPRFHGQSSGEMLLKDAKEIKREFVELSLGSGQNPSTQKVDRIRINRRRPEFWAPTRPEQRFLGADFWVNRSELRLPPPDLVHSLVDLFFRYTNPFFPILHRGQFELEIARGTHLLQVLEQRTQDERAGLKPDLSPRYGHYYGITHDYIPPNPRSNYQIDYTRGAGAFARVLLLVCACASRWSGDPRVLSTKTRDGEQGAPSSLSSGYDFFRAIGPLRATICTQPSLWDVQIFILSALFLHGSSAHYGSWTVLGIGIRLAQDIGAHRKKDGVSIENELYKRSFWALLVLDRLMCGTFGRPSAMQDLDSDLENLVEVDEEYWPVEGEPAQPAGKPSRLAFFNGMIGLSRVLGRALQTVFAIDRTRRQMSLVGHEKERELLADLRRHLERWKLTVPPHLQLLPPDQFVPSVFLDQMVSLWATYYNINILIHRPFITIKSSPLTTECLNICRTSARGCAKIIEGHLRLSETQTLPSTIQAAFSTAMVLLVDILATTKAGRSGSSEWPSSEDWYPTEEKRGDVEVCRKALARAESRWHIAGRLHDTLGEFQRTGNLLVGPSPSTSTTSPNSGRIQPIEPIALRSTQSPTFDLNPRTGLATNSSARSRRTSSVSDLNSPYESQEPYPSYGPVRQTYSSSGYDKSEYNSGYDNSACPSSQSSSSQPSGSQPPSSQPTDSYPYDQYYQNQSYSQAERQHNINPVIDSGAYLPEAYYGDNTNVPFPGLVPEFNFAPNQGRGDASGATGYQEPLRGEIQNPNWPSAVPHPTPLSQWEQLLRNTTWNMAGGAHPPP